MVSNITNRSNPFDAEQKKNNKKYTDPYPLCVHTFGTDHITLVQIHLVYRSITNSSSNWQWSNHGEKFTSFTRFWHRRRFVYKAHDIPLPLTSEQLPNKPINYITLPRFWFPANSFLLLLSSCKQRARLDDVATLATLTLYLLLTEVEYSTRS